MKAEKRKRKLLEHRREVYHLSKSFLIISIDRKTLVRKAQVIQKRKREGNIQLLINLIDGGLQAVNC